MPILSALVLVGCGGNSNTNYSSYSEEFGYQDGTYCAEVEYYYYKTGTRSTYTLEVEIESNELIKIYWPNGGWLDDSHFYPPDISDGYATFTSDRGMEYSIQIVGKEGECYTDSYVEDIDGIEREMEEEEWGFNNDEEEEELGFNNDDDEEELNFNYDEDQEDDW